MKKERKAKDFKRKAVYPGGPKAMVAFIQSQLQYPEAAQEAKIQGSVHVQVSINHLGAVIQAKVISGIGYGCDEEALRVSKLLKFEASKNRGFKSVFMQTMGFHFRSKPQTAPQTTISYEYTKEQKPPSTDLGSDSDSDSTSYHYTVEW